MDIETRIKQLQGTIDKTFEGANPDFFRLKEALEEMTEILKDLNELIVSVKNE